MIALILMDGTGYQPADARDGSRKRSRDVYESDSSPSDIDRHLQLYQQRPDKNNPIPKLFRIPSEQSKKGSRPSLGKVFTSLELDPLVYIRLEIKAKDYMLDPAHPDRRDVVAGKGMRNSDASKLKLRAVTSAFLESGIGEEHWGKDAGREAEFTPERTMIWPDDEGQIIKLVMPLLRKTVSNEKQRQYAEIAREQKRKSQQAQAVDGDDEAVVLEEPLRPGESVSIVVNLLHNDDTGRTVRMLPKFEMSAQGLAEFIKLRPAIKQKLSELQPESPQANEVDVNTCQYKAWLESGLVDINTDGDWHLALLSCESTQWMDGELRLLVFVGHSPSIASQSPTDQSDHDSEHGV